jgi:hypothetical protein
MVMSKVTDIKQFSQKRDAPKRSTPSALDECRETATARLVESLGVCLNLAVEKLHDLADKAPGLDMYHLHLDALQLVRDHADEIQQTFRKAFAEEFKQRCRRTPRQESANEIQFALVEPDDLEERLAAQALATGISNACAEELFGLGQRMGLLIDHPDLIQADNPLGPEAIGNALMSALNSADRQAIGIKIRLLAASLLNRSLPERVKEVYQGLNRQLVRRGVLPTLRIGMQRSRHEERSEPMASAPGSSPEADLFATLKQLMSSGRQAGGGAGQAWPAGTPVEAYPSVAAYPGPGGMPVFQTLNGLQHGQANADSGLDPSVLNSGRINFLHDIQHSPLGSQLGPLDVMTLDIVALLFDFILDEPRIPDAMKALIGRLQIPVLKVAMLDKDFFSHKNHPARMLLDALAAAAFGWDASEGHDGGLYMKIGSLVQSILDGYDNDAGIFDTALADLRTFLAEEQETALLHVDLSARVIHSREQNDLARQAAHDEIESRLAGTQTPEVIHAWLQTCWEPWLAALHLEAGVDSPAWAAALSNLDDLVWSVQPKLDSVDRRRFLETLPGLLKRLDADLLAMRLSTAEHGHFFADLVTCHADAVKAETHEPTSMESDAPSEAGLTLTPEASQTEEFQAMPETTEPLPEQALLVTPPEQAEPLVGRAELAGMTRGAWIEYRQEDGTPLRAKLFWISPLKGLYLFTNRLGQRAISITADGLERKLRSGEVTLVDDASLVERAVSHMVETLRQQAA